MTTICWRDGEVATDSQATRGATVMPEAVEKVWRVSDVAIAAMSGTLWWLDAMRTWTLQAFGPDGDETVPPPKMKDATLVMFWPERIVEYGDDGMATVVKPTLGYYAWGSGAETAFGALAMGADATEAVRVAAMFDQATGGAIRVMRIREHEGDDHG